MPTSNSPLFGTAYFPTINRNGIVRELYRWGRKQPRIRELLDELIGATAGAAALATKKRVQANRTENGGRRTIETYTMLSRNTTAADRASLRGYFSTDSRITTPLNRAGVNWKA